MLTRRTQQRIPQVFHVAHPTVKRKKVFGAPIWLGSYQGFLNSIFNLVDRNTPSYVCFANVHMIMEGYRDPEIQKAINEANLVAADGKPLSVFLRLMHGIRQERICGMDVLPDLLRRAQALGKAVYFYGNTEERLRVIIQKARKDFPYLDICGSDSPPFRPLTDREKEDTIKRIREAGPDLVLVSLGCPKQEKWMAEHRDKLHTCLLGVGQAFNVYAGLEKRLPKWMRDLSLEWIYRLLQEPGRLWRRYLYTNSLFLLLCLKFTASRLLRGRWKESRSKRINLYDALEPEE